MGTIPVAFDQEPNIDSVVTGATQNVSSFLTSNLEPFNTTSALPISLYEKASKQFVGFTAGGLYRIEIKDTNTSLSISATPSITTDIDFSNHVAQHFAWVSGQDVYIHGFVAPVEEIKIA